MRNRQFFPCPFVVGLMCGATLTLLNKSGMVGDGWLALIWLLLTCGAGVIDGLRDG